MALPADYISGTITLTNGSPDFTGTGTGWQAADFREGDILLGVEDHAGQVYVIETITGNAAGALTQAWAGSSGTYTYRMRYEWDSSRVSAQARAMVELLGNGNLESIAGLTGPGVVVLEGPHSAGIRPFSDFINGVAYNVQVDTLADRAAYDGQTAGFAVLVSDMGDGRSALFTKVTNASGDWTDPAYITGPVGPPADVTVGSTTTLPPGSAATVTPTHTPGGVELDFGIPAGEGFYWAGQYNSANSYNQDDVVGNNGSTFIAIQAVPAGEMPSGLFPPIDTAYWAVLATRGQDGSGTGDVVGPASAVDSALVAFDGTTGKLIKAAGGVTNAQLATVPTATVKGRSVGGTGVPTDLTMTQLLALLANVGNYDRSNIVGTVSQSGGVPTGAIVEMASNANGVYVRFAGGMQVCLGHQFSIGSSGSTWSFPANFINNDTSVVCTANAGGTTRIVTRNGGNVSVASVILYCRDQAGALVATNADVIAIGRWHA